MQKETNRWIILAASTIINFSTGSIYIWSIYAEPLMDLFGWTAAATALTYTICNSVGPVPMILGGKIMNRYGPRKVVYCSAFLFCGGMFLAGYSNSIGWMYMTYGVCVGVGMASIYICTISNTPKFFPDKRGFACGILTAGSGLSSIVAAPVAQALIDSFDVLVTLRIFGVAYFIIIMICASVLKPAPKEIAGDQGDGPKVIAEMSSIQMLKTPKFYLLLMIFSMGAMGGIMVISQTSNMAQEMISISAQSAALGVSIISFGNTAGRVAWGVLSDKFGRYNILATMFFAMAILLFLFSRVKDGQIVFFFITLVMIGFCFGGLISLFPAITAENFGNKNSGSNYGVMFTGYALGSMVGPRVAVSFRDVGAEPYSAALIIATIICFVGLILCLYLRHIMKKSSAEKSIDMQM